jgi:twitching motility protein PilT
VPLDREDNLFGRLALHYKVLTRDQLSEALRQQSREGGIRKIGEILIDRGWLTREKLEQLMVIQQRYQEQMAAKQAAEAPGTPAAAPPEPAPGPDRSPAAAPERAPAAGPETLVAWLAAAAERGASDLHVHAGHPVRWRIHGDLQDASEGPFDRAGAEALAIELLTPEERETLAETGQVEVATDVQGVGRVRGSAYRQQHGVDAVFRLIPPHPPLLKDLGLPLDLARLANFHQGLVLITGPAGCGKSSTLAALVNIVNRERREHIITIEDPIEYVHRSESSIVNQRQVGSHTGSFSRALRAALREDPDVIVVGELRDLETISLALTAAETGHLVLGTLHTSSALATINRLIGAFPPTQQPQIRVMVSESLRAIVCQRLVRRADGEGRVPALEILLATRAVSNLVRENKVFQIRSVLQTGSSRGMKTLDASLDELVKAGVVTREEARRHAEAPEPVAGQGPAAGGGAP